MRNEMRQRILGQAYSSLKRINHMKEYFTANSPLNQTPREEHYKEPISPDRNDNDTLAGGHSKYSIVRRDFNTVEVAAFEPNDL
jgi:hypothetical protein